MRPDDENSWREGWIAGFTRGVDEWKAAEAGPREWDGWDTPEAIEQMYRDEVQIAGWYAGIKAWQRGVRMPAKAPRIPARLTEWSGRWAATKATRHSWPGSWDAGWSAGTAAAQREAAAYADWDGGDAGQRMDDLRNDAIWADGWYSGMKAAANGVRFDENGRLVFPKPPVVPLVVTIYGGGEASGKGGARGGGLGAGYGVGDGDEDATGCGYHDWPTFYDGAGPESAAGGGWGEGSGKGE